MANPASVTGKTQSSVLIAAATAATRRLDDFQKLSGDAYPRACQDTANHMQYIIDKLETVEANAPLDVKREAEIRRAVKVCMAQIQQLDQILAKYMPGSRPSSKMTSKAVKDLYSEKNIPKIQKTLQGYEATFASLAAASITECKSE